jgi:hypothetical protein
MEKITNPTRKNIKSYVDKGFGNLFQGMKIFYIDIVEPLGHKAKEKKRRIFV